MASEKKIASTPATPSPTMIGNNITIDSSDSPTPTTATTNGRLRNRSSSSANTSYLTRKISLDRNVVYELLKHSSDELKFFYSCIETKSTFGPRFCHATSMCWQAATVVKPIVDRVSITAQQYDFDTRTPGNGMRSIIAVVDTCVLRLLQLMKEIKEQRTSLLFRAHHYVKELEAYVGAFVVLAKAVERVYEYLPLWPSDELFTTNVHDPKRKLVRLMSEVESLDQSPFYGRMIGFQFCSSLSRVFQLIGVSLASYSLLWDAKRPAANSLTGATSNLLTSGHYLINPEERAKRIRQVTVHADIAFCKAFWNLTEWSLVQALPMWVSPNVAVNEIWQIPGDLSLQLRTLDGRDLEVPPPAAHSGTRSLPMRVISYHVREGMPIQNMLRVFKGSGGRGTILPRSPCLLFHVHGGGFVATSSKTHEPYLRHWAKSLNCPLVSIDYSLAPENPYPRATEEIYYAYAWVLSNAERLGWTGERICFAGDSAGGLLLASTVLRLIKRNVQRLPDGLVLMYPAFLAEYAPSPSRLLSLLDPLLPLGVVARCLAAYTGKLEYLKNDPPPSVDSSQPQPQPQDTASAAAAAQTVAGCSSTDPPPPKKTLRDVVNNLDEQRRDVAKSSGSNNSSSSSTSHEGDHEVVNFIKGAWHPTTTKSKTGTGTEFGSDASDGSSSSSVDITPTGDRPASFALAVSSSDDDDKDDANRTAAQFLHRQLSRTSGGGGVGSGTTSADQSNESISSDHSGDLSPPTEEFPEMTESASSFSETQQAFHDPTCMLFSASCYDDAFLDYLRDQEHTKDSFRRLTVPLVAAKPHRVDKEKSKDGANTPKSTKPSASFSSSSSPNKPGATTATPGDQIRPTQSSGSLANLTWASAAIGHKMGMYVMDNLSGWFGNSGNAFDNTNLLNSGKEPNAAAAGTTVATAGQSSPSQEESVESDDSPLAKFHHMPVLRDPFLSPILAPEDWLTRFPRTAIVACQLDPLLDDSVSFAKRLKRSGVDVSLDVLDSLPHGFLNFAAFSAECCEGARVCTHRMREILRIHRDRA